MNLITQIYFVICYNIIGSIDANSKFILFHLNVLVSKISGRCLNTRNVVDTIVDILAYKIVTQVRVRYPLDEILFKFTGVRKD